MQYQMIGRPIWKQLSRGFLNGENNNCQTKESERIVWTPNGNEVKLPHGRFAKRIRLRNSSFLLRSLLHESLLPSWTRTLVSFSLTWKVKNAGRMPHS